MDHSWSEGLEMRKAAKRRNKTGLQGSTSLPDIRKSPNNSPSNQASQDPLAALAHSSLQRDPSAASRGRNEDPLAALANSSLQGDPSAASRGRNQDPLAALANSSLQGDPVAASRGRNEDPLAALANASLQGDSITASRSEPNLNTQETGKSPATSKRLDSFLKRNMNHPAIDVRRSMAQLQRSIVKQNQDADNILFEGHKGIEGFKFFLRKRYGSLVAGWRAMDEDKSGRITYCEFCNSLRGMGFGGNLRGLWRELDKDKNGSISLIEIDKKVGTTVGKFKMALLRKYGNMLTAWTEGIDVNKNGRIDEKEIKACVEKLGLDVNPAELFGMLTTSTKGMGLTLAEFDPDAWNRYLNGDTEGIFSKPQVYMAEDLEESPTGSPTNGNQEAKKAMKRHPMEGGARKWRLHQNELGRKEIRAAAEANAQMRAGLHTVDGFKAALKNRCGSLLSAWRYALDLDGNGKLTFGEFCLAMNRLGFYGNVKGLWKLLDVKKTGQIYFKDFDPYTDAELKEFRMKTEIAHKNMLLGWLQAFDTNGTGIVGKEQFVAGCEKIGFSGDALDLFKKLQPDYSRSYMTIQDFDTKAYLAMSRGDFRMLSEAEPDRDSKKNPLDMSFDERQKSGWFFQIREAWEAAQREEFAKATRLAPVPDHVIDTVEEFEDLCVRRYGSMIAAWRNCLDPDHKSRLSFNEFCKALRSLGYAGNFKAIFQNYDKDNKKHVSLKDLDPEAHELVTVFLTMLATKFGTLDHAWRLGFNKDPHDSIDIDQLSEACEALGYPFDAKKLFACLQPVPGRQLITIWDLDPESSRKKSRGDIPLLTQPKQKMISQPKESVSRPGTYTTKFHMEHAVDNSKEDNSVAAQGNSSMSAEDPLAALANASLGSQDPLAALANASLGSQDGPTADDPLAALAITSLGGEGNAAGNAGHGSPTPTLPPSKAELRSRVKPVGLVFHGTKPVEQLQQALRQKYGSTVAGWRTLLDPEMTGGCGQGKFILLVTEHLAFHGSVKTLWRDLVSYEAPVMNKDGTETMKIFERATCCFRDIDAHSQNILDNLRTKLISRHGSLVSAWRKGIDPDNVLKIDEAEWLMALEKMAIPEVPTEPRDAEAEKSAGKQRKKWFKMLLEHLGARALKCEDLEALLIGVPIKERLGLWADEEALKMPVKSSSPPSKPAMPNSATEQMNESIALRPTPGRLNPRSASPRDLINEWREDFHSQDIVIKNLAMFKNQMVVTYGSLFSGWRFCLDVDGNHRVTLSDFSRSCSHLGVRFVRQIFNELLDVKDANPRAREALIANNNHARKIFEKVEAHKAEHPIRGAMRGGEPEYITMFEYDMQLAETFYSFENHLLEHYKDTRTAWRKGFDLGNKLQVDKDLFVAQCARLGWQGDATYLFKQLKPEPGRQFVCYEDIWVIKDINGKPENPDDEGPDHRSEYRKHFIEQAGIPMKPKRKPSPKSKKKRGASPLGNSNESFDQTRYDGDTKFNKDPLAMLGNASLGYGEMEEGQ